MIVVLNVIGDTVIPLIQEKISAETDEGYSYEINEAAFDNIEAYRGI